MSFLGQEVFQWGIGVVEDRFDPEQLGRVRVRWLGIHDENKEKILTKDLPWSQVMQPATATALAGIGHGSAVVEGTWVVGFAKDPGTLQEWIVMGLLPGDNTTTAARGNKNEKRAWAQSRGDYKKFIEQYSTKIPGSANEYLDYEKGFFDPTVDQRNIPFPPSTMSYGNLGSFTPTEKPPLVDPSNVKEGIPRVMDWSDKPGGDHPDIQDLDGDNKALWEFADTTPSAYVRATHADVLHALFKTTRRITADERFKTSWTKFGTFRWADSYTYSTDGEDKTPSYTGSVDMPRKAYAWGEEKGSKGIIFSTGYLEPTFWSEDRDYGSKGGTYGPAFPVTRDTPAVSTDPTSLTGIDPLDTRASWGSASGQETGYWALNGEDYRVPHPRVRWVQKGHLSPTERETVMNLFNHGHYGTGIYNINDATKGRQDIKWANVEETDLVVVPTPDTNALAMGGIPISSTDGKSVTTASSLWGDSTTYFSDPNLSKGEPAKPLLQKGDIVQIAGVRGMQEINGRIFRLTSCSDSGTSFTMTLGTVDGQPWSGPGGISWSDGGDGLGSSTVSASAVDNSKFSAYLGGGVVIPHNPHWALCWKADMRERQINIGSPDPETGEELGMWNQPTGDFNARYPFNHVYESESGHIMEYDDTPGAERIHQFHRSGTHYEIDHNGNRTDYVKGDNYDIRLHDDFMYVKGKVVHTYDDEVMIRYNDRADISSKWKLQLWSGGDLDIHSKRNINMKSDGDINLQADGHINLHGTGVTGDQTKTYRAGSRNAEERSKIKMKAGHLEVEMVGNEDKPNEYGIYMQSDQNPIGIKTLLEGKPQGDIHIAAAQDMELFAWKNQYREAHEQSIYDYAYVDYYVTTETADVNMVAIDGTILETAKYGIALKSCTANIAIQASTTVDIKGPSNILLTGGEVHLNSTAAGSATSAAVGKKAWIPQTMELLSIDLPNPRAAQGTSISQLALNTNINVGYGGENIRNLHDTIVDMQLGLSAYVTKTYPATSETKTYSTDQNSYVWTGGKTHTLEVPWNGYTGQPEKQLPLGAEGPKRYDSALAPC